MVLAHNINEGDRTQDIRINQDVTFETMLLTLRTLQGLKDSGFYKPSPIQLHGIPLGKCGFDLLLEAKSGTGKTAVFSIIALEKIDINKGLQVVILAPTREIAMQIYDVIKQIGARHKGLCVEVVMGGLPLIEDIGKFKKNVHIVVASPGRLKHLIQDKYIDTSAVRLLILDEADKLMEKSFQSDINYIHLKLPKQKQMIMSSATYPECCKSLIANYVQNAQHICPDSNNILLGIDQKITVVKYNSNIIRQTQHRFTELLKILTNRQFKQCLIFCNYHARVSELYKMLTKEKWPVQQLYGQQDQTDRLDVLRTLQEYKCRLLISTDLAARGIDASNVDLVINFEPPFDWQTYLHRIGRAGRFGSYGLAVTILSEGREQNEFKILLESIKLPFLLTDLWTNNEFSVNNNDISNLCLSPRYERYDLNKESMPTLHKNNVKLWNALTSNLNLVESFHKINSSSSEVETREELESFHDLLDSFENNEKSNCTSSKFSIEDFKISHEDLHLQTKKSTETGNCDSKFLMKELQNNKETDDFNKLNDNFSKTGMQYNTLNLDKNKYHQVLDIGHKINGNCTNSHLSSIDTEELCDVDLSFQTRKFSETDNCDNEFLIKNIQNNQKTEDLNKMNGNYSKSIIQYSKLNVEKEKYNQVLNKEHSINFANYIAKQNGCDNNRNGKINVNLEITNNTSTEDDDVLEKDLNSESKMYEIQTKLELPLAFSSSKHLKSLNNHVKHRKNNTLNQGYFKSNECDEQLDQFNSKERRLKSNIIKPCKPKDKSKKQSHRVHHKTNSGCHDSATNGEDVSGKSKNKSKCSQYNHTQKVEKCNQTYSEWYSSLKLHVKQVELLMYFNELRQIEL